MVSDAIGERSLDRYFPMTDGWMASLAVSARDGVLTFVGQSRVLVRPRPSDQLVDRFEKLVYATDEEVFSFAAKWGRLDLCEHRLPAAHRDTDIPGERNDCSPQSTESIDRWREIAGEFRAMRFLGRSLRAGHAVTDDREWRTAGFTASGIPLAPLSIEDWQYASKLVGSPITVAGFPDSERAWHRVGELEDTPVLRDSWVRGFTAQYAAYVCRQQSHGIALRITDWMRWSGVRPVFWWDQRPSIRTGCRYYGGLAAYLSMQLALIVCEAGDTFTCDGCGNQYQKTERAPRRGFHKWCQECKARGKHKAHHKKGGCPDCRRRRKSRQ